MKSMNCNITKRIAAVVMAASSASIAATPAKAGFVLERSEVVIGAQPATIQASQGGDRARHPVASTRKDSRRRIDLESRVTSRISQSGTPPAELPVLRGMGAGVDFEDVLRMVLPVGWDAYSDREMPSGVKVNWEGNKTWPMVLHSVLSDHDMRAHIDWTNQEVTIFIPEPKPQPPVLTATVVVEEQGGQKPEVKVTTNADPSALAAAGVVAGASPAPKNGANGKAEQPQKAQETRNAAPVTAKDVEAEPVKAAASVEVKPMTWKLEPKKTLRENWQEWAQQAGWELVWDAAVGDYEVDYPVEKLVTFTGELTGEMGAIAQARLLYEDAEHPLSVTFYRGNRVIVVRILQVPDASAAAKAPKQPVDRAAPPAKPSARKPIPQDYTYGN